MSKVFRVINFFNKFIFFSVFQYYILLKVTFISTPPPVFYTQLSHIPKKNGFWKRFSVHVGSTTNFCFRARSGFAGKPNVKRERELIWHPHICQKWKGGHVGDRSTGRWESGGRPQIRIGQARALLEQAMPIYIRSPTND